MHGDIARTAHQILGQGPAQQAREKARARTAQNDLREVLAARETQQLPREIAGGESLRRGAKTLGQAQRVVDALHARDIRLLLAGPFDENRGPFRVEAGREARGGAHDAIGGKIRADADQQSFGGGPRAFDRVLAEIIDHLIVDALGGSAQGEFAQRREIAGREKILRRELGRLGNIDLSLAEALEEFVRRDVDENDIGGLGQHAVGHGLAHAHAGDARDHIGETLEMLDVERGPDVDAGLEQFLDILPPLRVAAVRRVGVGEFVDDDQLGLARQRRVYVEFLDDLAAIIDFSTRKNLQVLGERLRLLASMGFDETDEDIDAIGAARAGALQHRIGLADAGRRAEKNAQPAARRGFRHGEQSVRIGAAIEVSLLRRQCRALTLGLFQRVQREVQH